MKNLLRTVLLLASAFSTIAATAAPDLTLRYDKPAADTAQGWEREALPIGNGRIGAMVFGQLAREHLQFNDITLWTGDDKVMGVAGTPRTHWACRISLARLMIFIIVRETVFNYRENVFMVNSVLSPSVSLGVRLRSA